MEHSEKTNEIGTALANAQPNITGAQKDGSNPHYGSSFATLESCIEASRGALAENGLSVVQGAETNEETGGVQVSTMLLHKSGQWIRATLTMTPEPKKMASNPSQAIGSCLTYARRYGLSAMLGIYQTDDDGEGGTAPKKGNPTSKPTSTPRVTVSGLKPPTATPKATKKAEGMPTSFMDSFPKHLQGKGVTKFVMKFATEFPLHVQQLRALATESQNFTEFKRFAQHLVEDLKRENEQPTPPLR
jgi:hypothetical protein